MVGSDCEKPVKLQQREAIVLLTAARNSGCLGVRNPVCAERGGLGCEG
jgi:hypothetical protein